MPKPKHKIIMLDGKYYKLVPVTKNTLEKAGAEGPPDRKQRMRIGDFYGDERDKK